MFGDGYNEWLPYIILIISCIVALNLHNRLLALLRIKTYAVISTRSEFEEGKAIIEQARSLEERRIQRGGAPLSYSWNHLDQDNQSGFNKAIQSSSKKGVPTTQDLLARYNRQNKPNVEDTARDSSESKTPKPLLKNNLLNATHQVQNNIQSKSVQDDKDRTELFSTRRK